jgi:hypothetical protein
LSDDEVKTAVKMWFRQKDVQFYRDGPMKLPKHLRKCVDHTVLYRLSGRRIDSTLKPKLQAECCTKKFPLSKNVPTVGAICIFDTMGELPVTPRIH